MCSAETRLRTALVVGATGLVGSELVQQLAAHPGYGRVIVLARRCPEALPASCEFVALADHAQVVPDDLSAQVDHYFCALGTTTKQAGRKGLEAVDHHLVINTASLALQQGASLLSVVSALGASTTSPFHYSRVKGRMEAELESLEAAVTHIWQPSVLQGPRAAARSLEVLSGILLKCLPFTDLRPVTGAQLAKAIIAAATARAGQVHSGVSRYKVRDILQLNLQNRVQ